MPEPAFDLEKAIVAWRSSLGLRRTFLRDDLDELEDHLRREVARKSADGMSSKEAFMSASEALGSSLELETAYQPVRYGKMKRLRSLLKEGAFSVAMAGYYVRIAFRSFSRNRAHAAINIAGLAVALVACLLIGLYVQAELSYDRFHAQADQIYRVRTGTDGEWTGLLPAFVSERLVEDYSQVQQSVRIFKHWERPLIARAKNGRTEGEFYFADSTFLDVFSFDLAVGDRASALDAPHSVILTEAAARRYFGDENPLGETLLYNTRHTLTVTGVLADLPGNSHIQPEFVASLSTLPLVSYSGILDEWSVFYTYVVLQGNTTPGSLQRVAEPVRALLASRGDQDTKLDFQALTDIHLYSRMSNELEQNGEMRYVILMGTIGLLILLIACINHMNLATARAMRRAKEVAVRKVAGALRSQVIRQFYVEAAVMVGISLLLAGVLMVLLKPYFSGLMGASLAIESMTGELLLGGLILALWVGVLAGSYPALFLSRYRPAQVLKGAFMSSSSGKRLRDLLVLSQFTASAVLIVVTLIVSRQMSHIQDAELGFNSENVVVVPVQGQEARSRYQPLSNAWMELGSVASVGASASSYPGRSHSGGHLLRRLGTPVEQARQVKRNWVNADYFEVLGIDVVTGSLFHDAGQSGQRSIILNESAARLMGWSDPGSASGESIYLNSESDPEPYEIVGVVGDFNYESLHSNIGPLAFTQTEFPTRVAVRIDQVGATETLQSMQESWNQIMGQPFTYSFLDDELATLYQAEERWASLLRIATILALFIACLGLLGLAAFVAETKTREIGVRKALGATSAGIVVLVSRDFVKLILVATVIAMPISYFAMDRWLSTFAYRVTIGADVFLLGAAILLAIGLATTSFHAGKAAIAHPSRSLRSE